MKNQFAKIVAVLMVLAMAVSVFGLCASAAEETTEANVVLLGDVNLDGKVTIQDATLIQKAIAKLATLDEVQTAAADATEDGEVNIKDATAIQKWIAKVAGANENIGQPMVSTADEATPDQTPDESTPGEATPDQTPDESTPGEATPDQTPDESTKDEPVVDDPVVDEPTVTYNVAGAAGLCGVEWDPAANQMTDDGDGTWSITFTGVAAGTYEFKVVQDGAWGNPDYNLEGSANGGVNASVTVAVDDATVIIGFDGEKAVVEFVTAPATEDQPVVDPEQPEEPEEPATADETAYYLVGYINGADYGIEADWNNLGEYAFVDGTLTVEFAETSYVIVKDENLTGFWTDGWLGEGVTSVVLGEFGGNNNKVMVSAGVHTFTWDAATCTLTVA